MQIIATNITELWTFCVIVRSSDHYANDFLCGRPPNQNVSVALISRPNFIEQYFADS